MIRVFPALTALENLLVVTTGPHEAAEARVNRILLNELPEGPPGTIQIDERVIEAYFGR